MPLYEYYCVTCDHKYESMRPMSRRDELAQCPRCGEPGQRQMSAFGFKDGRYGKFFKAGSPTAPTSKVPRVDS